MGKGNGSPFRQFPAHPPVQQQLDMLFAGITRLADHLSELDLKIEFAMRQIQLGRKIPGALVDAQGRVPMEQVSLLQLYAAQRDRFAALILRERDEITRAQQAASAQGDGDPGHDDGHAPAVDPDDPPGSGAPRPGALILPEH